MSAHRLSRLGSFLVSGGYRGADMNVVRRITGAAALLTAAVIVVLSPLAAPDVPLGAAAGWSIVCVLVGSYVLLGLRLERTTVFRPDVALAVHYAALAGIALVIWLSDGRESPYTTLFLIWMALAGASHPPRRTLGILGATGLLATLPLFYDDWSGVYAGDMVLRLVIWSALTMMACVWTTSVRIQRADLIEDEEHAQRQARLDPLTGLLNRRAFDERVDRAIEMARLRGQPLSVMVSDLDGFKQINDSYGHLNGDEMLRSAAAAMRAAVRDDDACYRWGGDEFAVLLPGVDQDSAERVAERVSQSVVASCIRPDGEPQTLAWGTAELAPGMQASDLLASADLALMTRKHKRIMSNRLRSEAELPDSEAN
ncbi:MAG TPA: GGDEF domain-containing protein [Thermoleophilaceae bacterium]|nr:GGDEF domain-containing protein [Thermoleophilaceae bacterium]